MPAAPVRRDGVTMAEPPRAHRGRDLRGDFAEQRQVEAIGPVGAADQHPDDRSRQCCKRRKAAALGGQPLAGHAMDGAGRDDDARAAQPVVRRDQHQVEFAVRDARVLHLCRQRPAAAGATNCQHRGRGVAAAADDQIRPWRRQPSPGVNRRRRERRRP